MLDVVPELELAFLDLFHAVTNLLGFHGGQRVFGIGGALRFDQDAVLLLRELHQIGRLKF